MKHIKFVFIFIFFLSLTACKSSKMAMNNPPDSETWKAIVHTGGECGVYLTILIDGKEEKAFPVNLPDEFKKDALKIKFLFTSSRAPQPAGCVVDKVISVEQVEVLK
ncbi:MAG: hypothetical protein RIT43_94 [Bacteroidota bacterium]